MENTTQNAVNVPMGEINEVEELQIINAPPHEIVKPAPKKKSRKKTDKPSDRTVINNLKAELKELEEKLDVARKDIDIQAGKAEHYFGKYMTASKEISEITDKHRAAKTVLFKSVEGAMQAFSMITE